MFEQTENGNDGISVDAATICFVLGWLPFIIVWGIYNTAFTEWLVQTYFITVMILINYPRRYERKNFSKRWFWKAMLLVAVVVHPAVLTAMWFVDVSTKTRWHESATVLSICAVTVILEFVILHGILRFFRPASDIAEVFPNSPDA
jgi:hypothetical protein